MKILRATVGPIQGNCYIVSDDNGITCVIDPGGEPERLVDLIEKRELEVTDILLTHGHFDHMAAAAELAEATGAPIACAEEVAEMVRNPDRYIPFPGFEGIPGREPDRLLEDGDEIAFGDLKAVVISTPGHSPGDLTFEIAGNLFCGDLLFLGSVGRTDLPGGDFNKLIASVGRLMKLYPPETPVHPGHMESTRLGDELARNPFLDSLRRRS